MTREEYIGMLSREYGATEGFLKESNIAVVECTCGRWDCHGWKVELAGRCGGRSEGAYAGRVLSFDPTYPGSIRRWVITHVPTQGKLKGLRILSLGTLARFTFDTEAEAAARLEAYYKNPGGLSRVLTPEEMASLQVTACPCWPGHHDPCRTVFE